MSVDEPQPMIQKKVDEAWKEQVQREKSIGSSSPAAAQPREMGGDISRGQPTRLPGGSQGGPARPGAETGRRTRSTGPRGEGADFQFLLSSLSMQAMMALGELAPPGAGEPRADLEQARTLIDLLGVLEEKTRGNLSSEEGSLLENILYELRMRYVAKTGGTG